MSCQIRETTMKKLILMTLAITTSVLAVGCSSVNAPHESAVTSTSNSSSVNKSENFQQHKAQILQRINERLTTIQQIQSCVQAANNFQTMRACKPHRHKHHGDKNHHGE